MIKKNSQKYFYKKIKSPVGELKLVGSERGLASILWGRDNSVLLKMAKEDKTQTILMEVEQQLGEYFDKKRKMFNIELDFIGTDFQKKVWRALRNIPFGVTVSYGDIAKRISNPKAVRAVGSAIGKNPIPIIVACHRVIGSSGRLTGYAGGIKNKAILLTIEGRVFKNKIDKNSHV